MSGKKDGENVQDSFNTDENLMCLHQKRLLSAPLTHEDTQKLVKTTSGEKSTEQDSHTCTQNNFFNYTHSLNSLETQTGIIRDEDNLDFSSLKKYGH